MSTSVHDISQSLIPQASPCFDIQEFRSRSRATDDSFDFLPAIEVMSICSQLSRRKSEFGNTENRSRVRMALIPAVFGVDGSSPPQVSSWGYKPVAFPNRKEHSSKRGHSNRSKVKPKDEMNWDTNAHSQRCGYSTPAFHCRSPPAQLYKYKKAMKLEHSSVDHYDVVPGMTVNQAILFRRNISKTFLSNNQDKIQEYRKHNNTPVCLKEAPQKRASMPDLRSIPTRRSGREEEEEESGQCSLRQTYNNENKRVKPRKEMPTNQENKCSLCAAAENQDLKKNFFQAKKIDIKLPFLDTNHET